VTVDMIQILVIIGIKIMLIELSVVMMLLGLNYSIIALRVFREN